MELDKMFDIVMKNFEEFHSNLNSNRSIDRFIEIGGNEFVTIPTLYVLRELKGGKLPPCLDFLRGFILALEIQHELKIQQECSELENIVKVSPEDPYNFTE